MVQSPLKGLYLYLKVEPTSWAQPRFWFSGVWANPDEIADARAKMHKYEHLKKMKCMAKTTHIDGHKILNN